MDSNGTTEKKPIGLIRWPKLRDLTGVKSRNTISEAIRLGQFPAPVKLLTRGIAWRLSDVEDWIASRQPADIKDMKP